MDEIKKVKTDKNQETGNERLHTKGKHENFKVRLIKF